MNTILQKLNKAQKEAVLTEDKHVLILAGAGTGKTRAITSRIIYLIQEKKVNPYNILAVTFTNRAANEMKERVKNSIGEHINIMIKTFHSFGAYILRNEAYASERDKFFQIYDGEESKKALNEVIKKYEYSKKEIKSIQYWIERFKQTCEQFSEMKHQNEIYKEIYKKYNEFLLNSNCFDFGDLILEPIKIFSKYPLILKKYQDQYKYILIDEYQDTNKVQFELAKILTGKNNNLMVVGDEDQSIYSFRGADISNILNFEKDFKDAKIIKMEQNYRSTDHILKTANELIKQNNYRLGKNLFTQFEKGNKIILLNANNDRGEAQKIIDIISENKFNLNDTAILYRTNNQSRPFEQLLNLIKMPYVIIGSLRFFEREEIKDSISVLKWLANPKDRISFGRFVNKPSRGIGEKSLDAFFQHSLQHDNDLYKALLDINNLKSIPKKALTSFVRLNEIFVDKENHVQNETIDNLLNYYLHQLKIYEHYESKDQQTGSEKTSNIMELIKSLQNRGQGQESIQSYLEEVSLTSSNSNEDSKSKLKLLTIHNAKGLEFENVFISGLEDGLFPHSNSLDSDEEYEEERRLFYVAITRAKKHLYLTYCNWRTMSGWQKYQDPSPFLEELPEELIETTCSINNNAYYNNSVPDIEFEKGDVVLHNNYGKGQILYIKKVQGKHLAKIDFWDHSLMEMILEYTKLEKVID